MEEVCLKKACGKLPKQHSLERMGASGMEVGIQGEIDSV